MTITTNPGDATVRLGLPFLYPAQAQKEFFVNEAFARLDIMLHPVVEGIAAEPPAAAGAGACWIVDTGAAGAFAGRDAALASFDGTQWSFVDPVPGMVVLDRASAAMRRFGNGWSRPVAIAPPAGGATVDAEARQAIVAILQALEGLSLLRPG